MRKPTQRRAPPVEEWPEPVREAYTHILCVPHNTTSLAKAMRVSAATVARALERLRKLLTQRGDELVAVRSRSKWHYEIRPDEGARQASWDAFRALLGSVRLTRKRPGEDPDVAANT